jgi:hypothetical protein
MDLGDVNTYDLALDRNFQPGLRYFMKISSYTDDAASFQKSKDYDGVRICLTIPHKKPSNPTLSGFGATTGTFGQGVQGNNSTDFNSQTPGNEQLFLGAIASPPPPIGLGKADKSQQSLKKQDPEYANDLRGNRSPGNSKGAVNLGELKHVVAQASNSKKMPNSKNGQLSGNDAVEILTPSPREDDPSDEKAAQSNAQPYWKTYFVFALLAVLASILFLVFISTPPSVGAHGLKKS